jgi:pyruvate dehydrogenase E2 component (dihydrolipoamide acetyltransferase)
MTIRAFTMPKWGIEMTEGVVGEWTVAEGAPFSKGTILCLIESDKITNEVEAEQDGTLRRIVATVGETYPVGALLAVIADASVADAEIDAFIAGFKGPGGAPAAATPPAPAPAPAPAAAPKPIAIPASVAISPKAAQAATALGVDVAGLAGSGRKGRITLQDVEQAARPAVAIGGAPVSITPTTGEIETVFASPLAKRLAAQHGVDLAGLTGTGRKGRISKADVLAAVPAPSGVEIIRMSPMRKAIARRLTESKTTIPHFYLRLEVRMDALLALRERTALIAGTKHSVTDYLVRACALALASNPDVNIQVHGDDIHRHTHADIAVAVATDRGLLTPIVRAAETKSLIQISADVAALATKARDGRLQPAEFEGGTFSISNLGMFGIDGFDAVINPPQGAILAVGATRRVPIETQHALAFASVMALSLSCDHRAIDGAVGAKFLADLKRLIEAPHSLT